MLSRFPSRVLSVGCVLLIAISQHHDPVLADSPQDFYVKIARFGMENEEANNEIEFRTITPDQPVLLPEEGQTVIINIGLHITNKSSIEKKFLPHQIRPIFVDANQQIIPLPDACSRSFNYILGIPPFHNLKPGESIDFLDRAYLHRKHGKIFIDYNTSDRESCRFSYFKSGQYSVSIAYEALPKVWIFNVPEKDMKGLWMGKIQASPSLLTLIESR
jgi:hypothetical protein